jgi:dTDP-4-amino-4,6-dideoxygalactose transaminase
VAKNRKNKPAIEGGTPVRKTPLPFFKVPINETDVERVAATLRSGWLTAGPQTERLEHVLAEYLGVGQVLVVSSCSEAMFIALKALGIGPGDEVVTSSLTFASTVHSIIHTGATPVLVDIERDTLGPDPGAVKKAINRRTKAILPVHFGGQACRIREIRDLAARHNLAVVEDAAHSFGASVDGELLGGFSDATAFSFYATKNLTTAEGGALSTNDEELARIMRLLSYHGISRDSWNRYGNKGSWRYEVEVPGYKCNFNDILAALGLSQMERVEELLERRRAIARLFKARLGDSPYFDLPNEREGNRHTWHLFVIELNLDKLTIDRDRFIEALTEENIGNSVHFIPVYKHAFFTPYGGNRGSQKKFPVCEKYFSRCISLPIYPDMREADVDDVVEALTKITAHYSSDR